MAITVPAAEYVRMSSDKQETSPDQQREANEKLCTQNNYSIVSRYNDLGISGDATDKRSGFQQMVADAATGKFKVIVCWDQDRFGRFDLIEAGKWIEPLRKAGVRLHTATAGLIDWTSLTGQLSYMASQMAKAQYLQDLSTNVRRGQDRVEGEGKWTRGFPPFGYAVDEQSGKLIPGEPSETRILRAIFERYAAGSSQREICSWLNSQGVKTRRGNDWQSQSVRHTLNNMVYRGHLIYGKSSASRFLPYGTPDGKRIDRPESDWNVLHNTHPPLITQELFERCQSRKKENRTMTGPGSRDRFALTGLLYCGNCGSRMCGAADKSGKRMICIAYQNGKETCQRRTVKEVEVLPQVIRAIRVNFVDRYFGEAERDAIKQAMRQRLLDQNGDVVAERKRNKARLAELDGELEQAVTSMMATSEDLRPLIEKRVRAMQDERAELADKVSSDTAPAAQQIAQAEQRIDSAIGWLDRLEELTTTDVSPRLLSDLMRQFIERIEVDVDRMPQGKRTVNQLTGGRVFFRADSFPAWAIPSSAELTSLQEMLCFAGHARS